MYRVQSALSHYQQSGCVQVVFERLLARWQGIQALKGPMSDCANRCGQLRNLVCALIIGRLATTHPLSMYLTVSPDGLALLFSRVSGLFGRCGISLQI